MYVWQRRRTEDDHGIDAEIEDVDLLVNVEGSCHGGRGCVARCGRAQARDTHTRSSEGGETQKRPLGIGGEPAAAAAPLSLSSLCFSLARVSIDRSAAHRSEMKKRLPRSRSRRAAVAPQLRRCRPEDHSSARACESRSKRAARPRETEIGRINCTGYNRTIVGARGALRGLPA